MGIRDLGYKPYEGPRLSTKSRYTMMISRTMGLSWRSGLVKATFIVGLLPLLVCGVILYFKARLTDMMANAANAPKLPLNFEDAGIWVYYCGYWCQLWFGFAMSLLVSAAAISSDVTTGAFHFYFARPITRIHYATAKLVSAALTIGMIFFIPTFLLALLRIAIAQSQAPMHLPLLFKGLSFSLLATALFVLPPVAISSLTRKSGYALGGWAAIFFLPWVLGEGMAAATEIPWLSLISLPTLLRLSGQYIFGTTLSYNLPGYLPILILIGILILSFMIIDRRLSKVEVFS